MASFQNLWFEYSRDRRPTNIGDVVNGIRIGDLDDEIQDVAGSFAGLGADIDAVPVARLGLALERVTGLLPSLEPADTRAHFDRLTRLARAALVEIRDREA